MRKIVWKSLTPPSVPQQALVCSILDESLHTSFLRPGRAWLSLFFNGKKKAVYQQYALFFQAHNIDPGTGQPYAYGSFPLWKNIRSAWQRQVDSLSREDAAAFRRQIRSLLQELAQPSSDPADTLPAGIAGALAGEEFCAQLASLSMIASTWYIWEQSFEDPQCTAQAEHLACLILPTTTGLFRSGQTDSEDLSVQQAQKNDELQAHDLLLQARVLMKKGQYNEAGALCEQIVFCCSFAPDILLGEAFYLLACCCETELGGRPFPSPYTSVEELFLAAAQHGCDHTSHCHHNIFEAPRPSAALGNGCCFCNAVNDISRVIQSTLPLYWKFDCRPFHPEMLRAAQNLRFVLVDDNLEKNLQDALSLLHQIQNSSTSASVEIHIRCIEETAAPLLDTALSFLRSTYPMHSALPRVFLLDEAKRSAQMLFAQHPLFYPLSLPAASEQQTLHLVVLSSSPDLSLACWLVREAFWLLPVLPNTRITVLSPHADAIRGQLLAACPGLCGLVSPGKGRSRRPEILIDDIPFPRLEFVDVSTQSPSLLTELDKLEESGGMLYYVIDAACDLDAIALGRTVRETNIRHAVQHNRIGLYSKTRSVIALHCTDPACTRLSQDLLVPRETEHGNQWFNNYGFITFGSLDQLYSWDNLDGGILERISQCVHLQYCGAVPGTEEQEEALSSYFDRLYNRDSSFACAVGLPYRLFRAGVTASAWYIQDSSAYWGNSQRAQLAQEFRTALYGEKDEPDPALLEELSRYEHTRWCCYMLSRGWLPTSDVSQAVQIIKSGAPRHMLQIARLHPCICSWKELETLQRVLDWAYRSEESAVSPAQPPLHPDSRFQRYASTDGKYTYFYNLDTQNIAMTPEMLRAVWFEPNRDTDH